MKTDTTHEYFGGAEKVQGSSDRAFGVVFTVLFALMGLAPVISARPPRIWSLAIAGALLAVALVRPRLLAPFNRLWFMVGLLLHRIISPLILGLLFYCFFTPMASILRLLKKDLLRLRWEAGATSYWIERRPPGPAPETMRNQF